MDDLRELVEQWREESRFTLDCHDCADQLEEALDGRENVSEDLALSPEEFAALVGEGMVNNEPKRTNARVITGDSDE